mgnify:CR=1 FL=1
MPLRRLREPPAWLPALNPFALAGRAIHGFRPSSAPPLSRVNFRRELVASAFLPWAIAIIEGGILGVIVRRYFQPLVDAGEMPSTALNFAVALVTASPAFANISSFLFVRLAHGKHKVRAVTALQIVMAILASSIAFAPQSRLGLVFVLAAGISARMCYAGIVTLRSAVWRANYPRHTRARLTGRIAAIQTLCTAGVGLLIGAVLEFDERNIRFLVPSVVAVSLVGVWWWRRIRMRGHAALLRAEREAHDTDRPSFNPARLVSILIDDPKYAAFMGVQFFMGMGNMMTFAVIVIMTQEVFDLGYRDAMLATQVIPYLMIPVLVGPWSALLDRWHITKYRALHTWAFVLMAVVLFLAARYEIAALLFLASAIRGAGFAGGAIAWNLGHNDFARDDNAAQYMAVHVTLTGIRGLFAPFLGVAIYEWFESIEPGGGAWLFAICAVQLTLGAFGFLALSKFVFSDTPPEEPAAPTAARPATRS